MPPVGWGRPLAEMSWQNEFLRLLADPVYLGGGQPRGDGRPMVLVPGFAGGDWALVIAGSHVGLAWNRKAYTAIAEALHRPELAGRCV